MLDKTNSRKIIFILGVIFMLFRPTLSYAWEGQHDRYYHYHDHPRFGMRIELISNDYVPVVVGGARYYYYDGLYYTPAGNAYVLVAPPVGATVPALPPDYRPIMINGVTYYTDSGIFYVYTRYGYRLVPPPVLQTYSAPVFVRQPAPVYYEPQNQTKVAEGIGLGGILGALTGGIIGHQMKGHHELGGALLGGAAGAAAGGIVGAQMPNENVARPEVVVPPPPAVVPVAAAVPAPAAPQPSVATAQSSADESITINIPNGQGGYSSVIIKRSGSGFVGPQGEYYPEFPKVSQLQTMYSK